MDSRIAILHYTAKPSIGGVENLIAAQQDALRDLGYRTRLIVGSGSVGPDDVLIEALRPNHCAVPRVETGDFVSRATEIELYHQILRSLEGCDQCWVHNALTVNLNPLLTSVLIRLIDELPDMRWIAWCEDISAASRFTHGPVESLNALNRLEFVSISEARANELSALYSIPKADIRVIAPPLDFLAWLGLDSQARTISRRFDLPCREPIVFVPQKLLPHKNISLALHVAAELTNEAARPLVMISGARSPHERDRSEREAHDLKEVAGKLNLANTFVVLSDFVHEPIDHIIIRDLMLLSDVVFLPSFEEGFGMPVLEAAALRVPLLLSDIAAFREAGAGHARFFSLGVPPRDIAGEILTIAALPANQLRRSSVRSYDRFRREIADLVVKTSAAFA